MTVEMEYVYLVNKEKSFSKAAQKLFVSQSAVSAMVRKAEAKIGCQIFDRSTIPLTTTKEGEYYIRCAEQFMRLEKNMDAYFKDIADMMSGHLSVGSSSFFCVYLLAGLLKRFKNKYPGVTVEIHEGNIKELRAALLNNSIDLLLETALPADDEVERYFYDYEEIILAVPAELEVNRKLRSYQMTFAQARDGAHSGDGAHGRGNAIEAVPMQAFRECPFILLKEENDIYMRSRKICHNACFEPKVELYLDQIMTSFYVAKSGSGIAFIRSSLLSLVSDTDALVYYKIGDPLARREIFLTRKRGWYATKAMKEFLKLCGVHHSGKPL